MGSGVKYNDEFRDDVVRQVVEYSRPVRDVAATAGIKPDTLRTWIKRARNEGMEVTARKPKAKPSTSDLEAEIVELRKELRQRDKQLQERDKQVQFLKKAASFFAAEASDQQTGTR